MGTTARPEVLEHWCRWDAIERGDAKMAELRRKIRNLEQLIERENSCGT